MDTVVLADRTVTNAEWAEFVAAGGYTDPRWGSVDGWAAREREGWDGPEFDGESNDPVVGVSWYEVEAYCAWRTAQGDPCRMPTDDEWHDAATTSAWRIGDSWATPRYVWEWTSSPAQEDPARRVARGGSGSYPSFYARAAYRFWFIPVNRNNALGVRLARDVAAGRGAERMMTHTCPHALGSAEPCTCGGATCGWWDRLVEARGVVDVAGQHAMLLEMEPGEEVMTSVLRSLAALAAAGLALREACREHDEVARHGDCPVCAALDAFDAALAAALGPRQEQTDEHD